MAEAKNPEVKHFKCEAFAQLAVVVDGEVAARFDGFIERWQGEDRKVGYLATDDAKVQAILAEDGNVEEIGEKEFKDSTDVNKKGVRPVPQLVF